MPAPGLTADGADGTDKKDRGEWRQGGWCPEPATWPALCGGSLIREIRGPFFARLRVGHPSWALRAAPQPSGFAVGSGGPQSTQKDAEKGRASARTEYVRPGEAPSMSSLSPPRYRGASRFIGTDGLRRLWDATTPNPLRKRRGLEFWGRGTGGGGLTALPPATV